MPGLTNYTRLAKQEAMGQAQHCRLSQHKCQSCNHTTGEYASDSAGVGAAGTALGLMRPNMTRSSHMCGQCGISLPKVQTVQLCRTSYMKSSPNILPKPRSHTVMPSPKDSMCTALASSTSRHDPVYAGLLSLLCSDRPNTVFNWLGHIFLCCVELGLFGPAPLAAGLVGKLEAGGVQTLQSGRIKARQGKHSQHTSMVEAVEIAAGLSCAGLGNQLATLRSHGLAYIAHVQLMRQMRKQAFQ